MNANPDDTITATIYEGGNGFPDAGEYVAGDDGEVYLVIDIGAGRILTGRSGEGNRIEDVVVELADWADVDDDNEPVCSAIVVSGEEA